MIGLVVYETGKGIKKPAFLSRLLICAESEGFEPPDL